MTEREIINTFTYHPPTPARAKLHEEVRGLMIQTTCEINAMLPVSREASIFVTKMQEAQMFANAALAIHTPPPAPGDEHTVSEWESWWRGLTDEQRREVKEAMG